MSDASSNKERALTFIRMITDRDIEGAFGRYVDMAGTHHNPHYPAGFPALMSGMISSDPHVATKEVIIKNAVAEHDRVVVHFRLKLASYAMELASIFRFEAGKIVEWWDIGGPVDDTAPFAANI